MNQQVKGTSKEKSENCNNIRHVWRTTSISNLLYQHEGGSEWPVVRLERHRGQVMKGYVYYAKKYIGYPLGNGEPLKN